MKIPPTNPGPFRHLLRLALIPLLAFVLVQTSCKKQYFELDRLNTDETAYEGNWAIPLAHSVLTVDDILNRFDNDDLIVIDSATGQLALLYYSELLSISAQELLLLPDQVMANNVNLTPTQANTLNSSGSVGVTVPLSASFSTAAGEQLTRIDFKGGRLRLTVNDQIPNGGTLNLSIPSMTNNGIPFSTTLNFTNSGLDSSSIPLNGYSLDLSNGGVGFNQINGTMTLNFTNSGGGANSSQNCSIAVELLSMEFSKVFGDFGTQNVTTGLESNRIRVFDKTADGDLYFDDPQLRIKFYNSYGADMRILVNTFSASSPTGGSLNILGIPNPLNITSPSIAQIGQYSVTQLNLDQNNSNIKPVIAINPTDILYDVTGQTNPSPGSHSNFALDTSRLHVDVEVELPLYGTATNFTKVDTFAFDQLPDTVSETSYVDWILIRIIAENGFPCDASAQVYFADSNYNVVDSLFGTGSEFILKSGTLGATGRVTSATKKITDIRMERARVENLINNHVSVVLLKGKIETTGAGATNVRIYNDYTLDLRVGLQIQMNINGKEIKTALDSL